MACPTGKPNLRYESHSCTAQLTRFVVLGRSSRHSDRNISDLMEITSSGHSPATRLFDKCICRRHPGLRQHRPQSWTISPIPAQIYERLEFVVIHFNPIPIRLLEINLTDSIRAQSHLTVAFEIAILHLHLIEVSYEISQRRHAKRKV